MDTKKQKIIGRKMREAMGAFFNEAVKNKKLPIKIFEANKNMVDIAASVLREKGYEESAEFIADNGRRMAIEAASRLFRKTKTGNWVSPIWGKAALDLAPIDVIEEIVSAIMINTKDTRPYKSAGIQYGTYDEKGKPYFVLYFRKYTPPVSYSEKELDEFIKNSILTMKGTKEFEVLEHIYETKMGSFTQRNADVFIQQMESIKLIMGGHLKNDELLDWYWNNGWIESIRITGIWDGVHRLLTVSDGLVHNAELAFVAMYNQTEH